MTPGSQWSEAQRRSGRSRWAVGRLAGTAIALTTALTTPGCQLEKVTIPLGQAVVVVQSVITLDPRADAQYVVVERSLTGTMEIPNQDSLRGPPRPPVPISNALVRVTREDSASAVFAAIPDTLGVYRLGQADAPGFWQAGRQYRLLVVTPDGDSVRGRMRMPAIPVVTGLRGSGASLNRDRDTLDLTWSGGGSTKGVFVQVRPRDLQRRLTLIFFTDSTHFRVSGRIPLPFETDTIPPVVWVAGSRMTFSVAAMDTNFFNFLRSGNDPFTGSGFINSLTGGLGVFGAVAPVNETYEVRAEVDHPYEGRYTLVAKAGADSAVLDVELYVNRDRPEPVLVNGLVRGTLFRPGAALVEIAELAGRVENGGLHAWLIGPGGTGFLERSLLVGGFDPGGTATGTLRNPAGADIGTWRMTREP